MRSRHFVIVLVLGCATGFGAAAALGLLDSGEHDSSPPSGDRLVEELRGDVVRLKRELEAARRPGPPAGPRSRPPATPDPLDKVDAGSLEDRAEAIRKAALDRAANAEAIVARQIRWEQEQERRRKAAEAKRLADEARGGTMGLLRSLDKDWIPLWDLVGSEEAFGVVFRRQTSGSLVDGYDLAAEASPGDGATIVFPAGRHPLNHRTLRAWKPFPKDLRIQGQGMDLTLLVLDGKLDSGSEVENLQFADLTIHTDSNRLESLRSNPYTIRLERCRVVGFDTGAGGGDMLSGSVCAFHATDSRFESGYGRSPGHGMLFDVRGALLARMERCVIRGPLDQVFNGGSDSAIVFSQCSFLDTRPELRRELEKPPPGVRLQDCTVEYLPEDAEAKRASR
jgi:hypothetical protein